ncbi:MAG TPA: AAA family ATPase, partial [Streptosporangiales bacterium]
MATGALTGPAGQGAPVLGPPSFVGRRAELAAFGAALARPPAVVFVAGEAGIGKSRLVREALVRRGAGRDVVAVCPPFREPLTLGAIVDAVRDAVDSVGGLALTGLAGALRSLFPEWADDLPPAPPPAEDPSAARHRLFRALAELLHALDTGVLVVEDVHWADEATLEFLLFLAARGLGSTSLVVTYRPEDVPADSLLWRLSARLPQGVAPLRLQLVPLDVGETASLVSSMLADERVSAEFAAFIHEGTDGIPLAVEESVRVLQDRADLVRRADGWVRRHLDEIAVPPSIRDAVLERAARLSPAGQAVLRAAAVLAVPSTEWLLLTVAGGTAPEAVTEAVASGLLDEDVRGLVSFRHELSARAVHDAVPAPQLRAMHRTAGEALERTPAPPVASLARHFREAGETERWYRYAELAADRATASGDEATSAAVLHELITAGRRPAATVIRLCRKLSYGSYTDARLHELAATLRARSADGDVTTEEAARLRFELGRLLFVIGDYEAGRVELEAAYDDLPPRSVEAVRTMMYLGAPLGDIRPAATHLGWLRRASALLPLLQPADQLRLRSGLLTALLMLGEDSGWCEGERIPDDADTARERQDLTVAHANMGEVAMVWGRYADARAHLDRAAELARRYDYRRVGENINATSLRLRFRTGDWHGLAGEARALAENHDVVPRTHNEAVLVEAEMRMVCGDVGSAVELLAGVRDVAARCGDLDHLTESVAMLGRALLGEGRVAEALEVTERAISTVVDNQMWLWLTE